MVDSQSGSNTMYVTYDLERNTPDGGRASFPRVKRVSIHGEVKDWTCGDCKKRSGRTVYGVAIEYQGRRAGFERQGYTARRGGSEYRVSPAQVRPAARTFRKVVPLPTRAENVHFYPAAGQMPYRYRYALEGH